MARNGHQLRAASSPAGVWSANVHSIAAQGPNGHRLPLEPAKPLEAGRFLPAASLFAWPRAAKHLANYATGWAQVVGCHLAIVVVVVVAAAGGGGGGGLEKTTY